MEFTKVVGRDSSLGSHGSLDGVPVKVSEKCLPPKKVILPLDFEYRVGNPTEILFMEYDFSLEEKVVAWCNDNRQLQEKAAAQAQAEAESQAAVAEQQGTLDIKNVEPTQAITLDQDQPQAPSGAITDHPVHTSATEAAADATVAHATYCEHNPTNAQQGHHAQPFFPNMDNGILVPTRIVAAGQAPRNCHDEKRHSSFDLKDFESEQDPFDNLELKVLDDLAELDKVLQGAQAVNANTNTNSNSSQMHAVSERPIAKLGAPNVSEHAQVQSVSIPMDGTCSASVADATTTVPAVGGTTSDHVQFISARASNQALKDVDYPDIDSIGSLTVNVSRNSVAFRPEVQPELQQVQDKHSTKAVFSTYQPLPPISTTAANIIHQPVTNKTLYSTESITSSSYTGMLQSQAQAAGSAGVYNKHLKNSEFSFGYGGSGFLTGTNGFLPQGMKRWSDVDTGSSPRLRSARSTPDIAGKLEQESSRAMSKSHTPPPYPRIPTPPPLSDNNNKQNSFHLGPPSQTFTAESVSKTYVSGLRPRSVSPKQPSRSESPQLPDPYRQLSREKQRFADNIIAMGFARMHVARAVDKLGQDDKAVIDHLCLVSRLSEQGQRAENVQAALLLFNNEEAKAQDYLKLLQQFQELGFKEDRVQAALLSNDLDHEKTLENLLAGT